MERAITLSASWDVYAHRHQHIEIYGTEGAVFVPDPNFFGGEVMLAGTGSDAKPVALWDHPFTLPNWKDHGGTAWPNYRAAGLADMAVGILKKRDIRCGISRMAHVVEIMTAIAASAKSRPFCQPQDNMHAAQGAATRRSAEPSQDSLRTGVPHGLGRGLSPTRPNNVQRP